MPLQHRDRKMTVEELYTMPDDGYKYELQAGMPVAEPLPGYRHGRVAARITEILSVFVRKRRLGVVITADSGFILARRPDTVRGPDVAYVSDERHAQSGDTVNAFSGPPDLAVEVLSPSITPAAIRAKVADYLAAGTRCVWVVDSEQRAVEVYTELLSPQRVGEDDFLEGGDVLPGFRVRVGEIFEL